MTSPGNPSRRKSILGVLLVLGLAAACLIFVIVLFAPGQLLSIAYDLAGFRTSTTHVGSYFRYRIAFKVDGTEDLTIDNVIACSTRIRRSKAHGMSVLPGMTPNLFVKRTKDNHAILVTTPKLCSWARTNSPEKNYTEEGFMPPAVVWFDDADDLTFGIAYVTKTAYASKKSRLELVSTYVGPATRQEFEAWYDGPRKQNLAKQDWINPPPGTTSKRWAAHNAYIRRARETKGRAFPGGCYGSHRFKLTPEAQAIIRSYWPADRPKYWTPSPDQWDELYEAQFTGKAYFIGKGERVGSHFEFWTSYSSNSSPFGPNENKKNSIDAGAWPAETYPTASSVGAPFLTEDSTNKEYYLKKIFFEDGTNDGFAWCYSGWGAPSRSYDDPLRRHHYVDVDDLRARTGDEFENSIKHVFEADDYMFRFFSFGIHPNGGVE